MDWPLVQREVGLHKQVCGVHPADQLHFHRGAAGHERRAALVPRHRSAPSAGTVAKAHITRRVFAVADMDVVCQRRFPRRAVRCAIRQTSGGGSDSATTALGDVHWVLSDSSATASASAPNSVAPARSWAEKSPTSGTRSTTPGSALAAAGRPEEFQRLRPAAKNLAQRHLSHKHSVTTSTVYSMAESCGAKPCPRTFAAMDCTNDHSNHLGSISDMDMNRKRKYAPVITTEKWRRYRLRLSASRPSWT